MRIGACGYGWQTPADARLEFDSDGVVVFYDGSAGASVFPALPTGEPVIELVDGAVLARVGETILMVRTKNGLAHYFPAPAADQREVLVSNIVDLSGNWVEFVRSGGLLTEIRENAGQRIVVRGNGPYIESLYLVTPVESQPRLLVRYGYAADDLGAVQDALGA